MRPNARGYTLIELLVSVAIVGLLATVVLPMTELAVQRNKERELRQALLEIRTGLDAYKRAIDEGRVVHSVIKSGYPATLKVLVDGEPDAGSPDGKGRVYFLRRIPRDPMNGDPDRPDEATWGKRSYESPANAPAEGEDVFDVYSMSPGVGLNGVPYRNW
ncbi:MAG: general secretion pathway protein GspG [Gallionellales bacterium GWA2_60_142]|nr:MAG: general secretion pathway protein GspG [Gallionellales bacterium GWA2_60_142]HCI13819.1 general secretion pathway protein GspG [Gallionellaceae bacterium]